MITFVVEQVDNEFKLDDAKVGLSNDDQRTSTLVYTASVCLRLLTLHFTRLLNEFHTNKFPGITLLRHTFMLLFLISHHIACHITLSSIVVTSLSALRTLLLDIALDRASSPSEIRSLACNTLITALRIFYPSNAERGNLLSSLLAPARTCPRRALYLEGLFRWFTVQPNLVDVLLVNKPEPVEPEKDEKDSKEKTSTTIITDGKDKEVKEKETKAPVVPVPVPVSVPEQRDTSPFIKSLVDYAIEEFHTKRKAAASAPVSTDSSSSKDTTSSSAAKSGTSSDKDDVELTPIMSLLLVLEKDLVIKSGLFKLRLPAMGWGDIIADKPEDIGIQPLYFNKLLEFSNIVLSSSRTLLDQYIGEEEIAGGATGRPLGGGSQAPRWLRQSPLMLLPALLTALGSDELTNGTHPTYITRVLPSIQQLLAAVDKLNQLLPDTIKDDAR
jgi:hypothetical protein